MMRQGVDRYRMSGCGGMSWQWPEQVLSQCWKMQPKPYKEETARSIFEETAINITTEGRKHQGAAIGSTSYLKHYVNGRKRNGWGRFQNWLNLLSYFWIKISLDVLFRNSAWYRRSTRSSGVCNSRCPKTVHHRSQLYTSWTWAAGAANENRRHMLLNPSQVAVL